MVYVNLCDKQTGQKYCIGQFDFQDVIRLLTAINRYVTAGNKNINWKIISRELVLPEISCKRVWRHIQRQIYKKQHIFDDSNINMLNLDEPSIIVPDNECNDTLQLDQLTLSQLYNATHQKSQGGIAKQSRQTGPQAVLVLSEQEEQLFLYALYYHGPEYDYIAKRYLNNKSQYQLKTYFQNLKKHAIEQSNYTPQHGRMDRYQFRKELETLFQIESGKITGEQMLLQLSHAIYGVPDVPKPQ